MKQKKRNIRETSILFLTGVLFMLPALSQENTSAITLQKDGKIVQAGSMFSTDENGTPLTYSFGVVRFNEDGSPDHTFGKRGKVLTRVSNESEGVEYARALAIMSDGKILVAGNAPVRTGHFANEHVVLVRYNTDGSLDSTFGDAGIVRTIVAVRDYVSCLAVQPDEKFIVAGRTDTESGAMAVFHVRYNSDGTPDETFGSKGKSITNIGSSLDRQHELFAETEELKLQKDGKLLTGGYYRDETKAAAFLLRQNPDGTPDESFANSGKAYNMLLPGSAVKAISILPDNRLLIAGTYCRPAGISCDQKIYLARYTADGWLDKTFGNNGFSKIPEDGKDHFPFFYTAYGLIVLPDGKIVVTGEFEGKLSFLKFNSNGSFDYSVSKDVYHPRGTTRTDYYLNISLSGCSIHLLKSNKILIGGNIKGTIDGEVKEDNFKIVRLNSNGTIDKTFGKNGFTYFPLKDQ